MEFTTARNLAESNRTFALAFILVAGLAAGAAGCAPEFTSEACESNDDCLDDEACIEGACRLATEPAPTTDTDDTGADDTGPQRSFNLEVNGLSDPVTVRYDRWGVLHIDCETLPDCILVQGYFHADDRFFQMDLIRRQTRGELSTLIGLALGTSSDETFRHLMTTREGEPLEEAYLESMSDETREMFDAYTKGINVWLDDMRAGRNGATLTEEYEFSLLDDAEIPDWEDADSVALYLMLAYQLSFSSDDDIFRGEMIAELGPEVGEDLFTVKPGLESNTFQAAGVQDVTSLEPRDTPDNGANLARAADRLAPASKALGAARERLESSPSLAFGPGKSSMGSNNWVVGPDQTRDDVALLANDPHLTLSNPAIWYYVELHADSGPNGGLHAAGASIPAAPGIVVGHNEHVGWGVTTARLDLADAYVEELNSDGTAVIRDGEEVPLIEREYTLDGLDENSKTVTFEWVPDHGPLISKDAENQRGVSVKWVAQGAGNDLDFLLGLMRSESVDDAMDALEPLRTINQSWALVDDEGSIGWYPKGAIPKRPWASAETPNWLPVPGDGSAEWNGFVSAENAPKLVDPPAGSIATANNDFDGSYTDGDATNDGHTPWQSPPSLGHRHKRIVDRIEADAGSHTVDTMHDIQADTYSLHGEILVPHILETVEQSDATLSEGAGAVRDALSNWEYGCPTGLDGTDPETADATTSDTAARESAGCAAFHVLFPELTELVFDDELESVPGIDARSELLRLQSALLYLFESPEELERGTAYFDDQTTSDSEETREEIVLEALEATATELEDSFESVDSDDWHWGQLHTVTLQSLFASAGIDDWNEGPYANDGGFDTVDEATPGSGVNPYGHSQGPSIRLVVRASEDGVEGWFQLPGGQDHRRDSEYYMSLMDDWLRNKPHRLLFTPDEIEAATDERIHVETTGR